MENNKVNKKMDKMDSNTVVDKKYDVLWSELDIVNALQSELQPSIGKLSIENLKEMPKINGYGCSIDTRSLKKGDLFFAIDGEHVNGAKFWLNALRNGAECVIANKNDEELMKEVLQNELSERLWGEQKEFSEAIIENPWKRVIFVKNTRNALKKMAQFARKRTNAYTIGVTGSVGKTTTKDILYFALKSMNFLVHRSEKSFNNDLGLPLSLVNMQKNAEIGVFEIGMNNPGEIHYLAHDILKPNMGLVVSIAPVHIGNFDYIYKIFQEKCSLFDCISDVGFLNENVFFPRYYKDTSILNLLNMKSQEENMRGKELKGESAEENLRGENSVDLEEMVSLVNEDIEKVKQRTKNMSTRKEIQLLRKNDLKFEKFDLELSLHQLSSQSIEKSQEKSQKEGNLLKVKVKRDGSKRDDGPLEYDTFLINEFNKSIASNFYIAFMAILHLRNKVFQEGVFQKNGKFDSRFDKLKTAFVNFGKVSGRGKISHVVTDNCVNDNENASGVDRTVNDHEYTSDHECASDSVKFEKKSSKDFFIIDESYNANLMSMKNALSELRKCDLDSCMRSVRNSTMPNTDSNEAHKNSYEYSYENLYKNVRNIGSTNIRNPRKIAVLGDMKELGMHSMASHVELIRYCYEFFGKNLFNDVNDMQSDDMHDVKNAMNEYVNENVQSLSVNSSIGNAHGENETKIILVGNAMVDALDLLIDACKKHTRGGNSENSGALKSVKKDSLLGAVGNSFGTGRIDGSDLLTPDFDEFLSSIIVFQNANEVLEYLKKNIKNNDIVMVKGSNSLGLRKIVTELKR